ncbi:hypothetical protein [Mucilaginibacter sp. L196]|uniref:hypothetical protein n=1 Tax=Mucilaginibacter sp. L196 TaxID=1641870 RepID=UPI00131D7D67|nr:hypothetical protein [Mucilaginibacter sp. L196]
MRYFFLILGLGLVMAGCGGGKNSDNISPTPPSPKAAALVFPAQNAICVSGTVISASQSTIQFQWNNGLNSDSYVVVTKNLLTGDTLATNTGSNSADIQVSRNTPYSWYVVSKSNQSSSTAKSDTWKFYNSGAGVTTYAPFPADNLSPVTGQNIAVPPSGEITLNWKGGAVDNDIVDYDVYLGLTASPPLYKSHVTTQGISNVVINSNATYYWKIATRDSNNNTSTSDVVEFTTN